MSSKDSKPSTSIALFQEKTVWRVWYQEKWYFSVIDVMAFLAESANPRRYRSDLKRKHIGEGYGQLYDIFVQLKLCLLAKKALLQILRTRLPYYGLFREYPLPRPITSNNGEQKLERGSWKKSKIQSLPYH
jgi:hypothetical protein